MIEDIATRAPIRRLAAMLDDPAWGKNALPPLGHWLYFLPDAPQSSLGADGHPKRDEVEAKEFPRRMWAGGRIDFLEPIAFGTTIQRTTNELRRVRKEGRSGPMIFVTLEHRIFCDGRLAIVEEQDLVYRAVGGTTPPVEPLDQPIAGIRSVVPDSVMLFRFSALTFNAHRIHYDLEYARAAEGYPELVVHGPLLATLLLHAAVRETGVWPHRFSFRAERPAFCNQALVLRIGEELSAVRPDGLTAMTARISA